MSGVKSLLSCDIDERYEDLQSSESPLRRPTLETELSIVHAALIAGYEKELYDFLKKYVFVVSVYTRENLYLLLASQIL